jgi:hypothetical protein
MQRVRTESGSVYDVDAERMRIRRVHGRHGPADSQPQDGIWRRIAGIEGPVVGHPMVVYWATEPVGGRRTDYGFRTTTVVAVDALDGGAHRAPFPRAAALGDQGPGRGRGGSHRGEERPGR